MRNRALSVLLASAFALAGCGGARSPGSPPDVSLNAHRGSGSSGDLLYVADTTAFTSAFILIYSYPPSKQVRTVKGSSRLMGECADANGDVFVVSPVRTVSGEYSSPTTIYEFAHGGTEPVATLVEQGYGSACSVDPTTGNLAVPNSIDVDNPYQKDSGDVAVFSGARGNPKMYYSETLSHFTTCGYDDKGNLYLSVAVTGGYELASLGSGSSSAIEPLSLNANLYSSSAFAPSVQWDGQHMTVSSPAKKPRNSQNSGPINVYRLSISGSGATVIGTTALKDNPERHRGQSWIQGNTIVGVNYDDGRPYITVWPYPKGGAPTTKIKYKQELDSTLYGVTVSVAPSE